MTQRQYLAANPLNRTAGELTASIAGLDVVDVDNSIADARARRVLGGDVHAPATLGPLFVHPHARSGGACADSAPRCAGRGGACIQVDNSAAFDRVRWDFMAEMLKAMGFPAEFRAFVQTIYTDVRYRVKVNGHVGGVHLSLIHI